MKRNERSPRRSVSLEKLLPMLAVAAAACGDGVPLAGPEQAGSDLMAVAQYSITPPGVPEEFETPPTILSYSSHVWYSGATASTLASMEYWGNRAEQTAQLGVRPVGGELQWSQQFSDSHAELFPWTRVLNTYGEIYTGQSCGHRAEGYSSHKTWHQWDPLGFQWGMKTGNSQAWAEQDPCSGGGGGGGNGGGGGEGQCFLCQQWFWYENGEIVEEWWDCWPIDFWYCEIE